MTLALKPEKSTGLRQTCEAVPMSTEIVLFLLRIVSALVLMGILVISFLIMWKDYRGTVKQLQASRRTYGKLVAIYEIDDSYLESGETHPLLPWTYLGRSPTNNVVIDDSFASNEHAQIVLRDGQWWLEDRHSRNGTTLNEIVISQPVVMTDGDIIGIGQKHFKLDLE